MSSNLRSLTAPNERTACATTCAFTSASRIVETLRIRTGDEARQYDIGEVARTDDSGCFGTAIGP